jgi:hypothetical protein
MSPTKRRLTITLVTLLLVALVPAAVMAAGGTFTDDDDSIFESNIEWLASADVTKGCNPAEGNTKFCPNDNVTRGQMAAFMQRFAQYLGAEDGTPAQADNAATLDGQPAIDYRTVVAGVDCQGSSCNDFEDLTNAELLELTINAPAAGYLQITGVADLNVSAPANEYVSSWLTLNGDPTNWAGCEGSFIGVPIGDNLVNGSNKLGWLDGNIFHTTLTSDAVVAVSAGTNTIRLCGFGSVDADTWTASLTALWTAAGTASHADSVDITDIPAYVVDRMNAATEN